MPGGKVINEHVGRVNTGSDAVSVAHMIAPANWGEPFQTPGFDEITLVLKGSVIVDHEGGPTTALAGQSILTGAGERVRYSCGPEGAEYVAVPPGVRPRRRQPRGLSDHRRHLAPCPQGAAA